MPLLWRTPRKLRKLLASMSCFAIVWLLAQSPLTNNWHKLTDRTFTGVYHANTFDLLMMIPYFIVLTILAVYGMHRYWLVYDYYKNPKKIPRPPPPAPTGPA